MIKQLFARSAKGKTHVGIEIQPQGLAVVAGGSLVADTAESEGQSIRLRPEISYSSLLLDESSDADRATALADWVESNDLLQSRCTLVLPSSDYQLLLVEAPDVPDEELRDAIRWRIKELSSVPVEKAAIDVFLLPKDGARGGKTMAYVVVTELEKIAKYIELVKASGLVLSAIDISELALRNLAYLYEPSGGESRGIAIVRLQEDHGVVSLYRNGNMYLSRQFKIQYGGGLLDDIPIDAFNLEVQRSLDYFERQMGQIPPAALYVCGENVTEDKISIDIVRGINVPVKYLDLEQCVQTESENEQSLLHTCVVAIGGAIRESVASDYSLTSGGA